MDLELIEASHCCAPISFISLAEEAFHRQLISGYGDGEFPDKYQIIYQGKPRHLSLEKAYLFLKRLVNLPY